MNSQSQLFSSLGVSLDVKSPVDIESWDCYSLNHNSKSSDVPILIIESGTKSAADITKAAKRYDTCVIIDFTLKKMVIKTLEKIHTILLESDMECSRIADILNFQNIKTATNEIEMNAYLENAIDAILNSAGDFDNRGLFSTHYLRNRIFDDAPHVDIDILRNAIVSSRAEPSRAEPSRAEPSRAEPSRAEPSRAEPSRAEPSRAQKISCVHWDGRKITLTIQHE